MVGLGVPAVEVVGVVGTLPVTQDKLFGVNTFELVLPEQLLAVIVGVKRQNESYVSRRSSREYSSSITKPSSTGLILRAQSTQ